MKRKQFAILKKHALIFLLLLLLLNVDLSAQSIAKANKLVEDFGLIESWDKKYKTTFLIQNKGDKPFKIMYVSSNCGCTVPFWDKKMIAPGKSASIEVVFDPTGKRDSFKQHINVYTKASIGRHIKLTVKGIIDLGEERLSPTEKYIRRYGSIKFEDNTATFMPLYKNEVKSVTIIGKNIGNYKIFIEKANGLPQYLTASFKQQYLMSNDTFHVKITAIGEKAKDISKYFKEVRIKTDDFLYPVKTIYVVMDVRQFFPKLTRKQYRKSPRIEIDTSLIEFGKFRRGTKGRDSILIRNKGKEPLKIFSINSYCTCLKTDQKVFTLLPGEKRMLQVYFDPVNKSKGIYNRSFRVICNDPRRPRLSVPVSADLW